MRCKIGDLCVVVKSNFQQNIGSFVIIVGKSKLETCDWICETYSNIKTKNKKTLMIEKKPLAAKVSTRDDHLRPIGDDEMIRIAGMRNKIKEVA